MWQKIPAICSKCGKISFDLSFEVNTKLVNVTGPVKCPYCGGRAELRMDIYNIIHNIVDELNNASDDRIDEIREIIKPYNQPLIGNFNYFNIASEISNKASELKSLKDLLPKTRTELYMVIGIIVSVLVFIQQCRSNNTPTSVNQIIDNTVPVSTKKLPPIVAPKTDTLKTNLSRNDKCHCGSGKKFKHCHGR